MKKREPIIKTLKKGIAIIAIGIVLSTGLTSCNFSQQEYVSQEEIIETADLLDCDTGYLMKHNDDFVRMKHNDGEPIYICFDEQYPKDLKEKAKQSLDYIFGIVGKINSKYRYEIVDKAKFDSKLNKTKIFYTFGEVSTTIDGITYESDAHLESHRGYIKSNPDDPLFYYYELKIIVGAKIK